MRLVLITVVLEFSGLVLYEAVLSYLGIGVDPSMNSFGAMMNGARTEMSRDPMIWWNLLAAFAFMLALVLPANLFADAVRDAFDPRTRRYRPATRGSRIMNAPALLDVGDLSVDVAGECGLTRAVKRLSLSISRGETFALVGESDAARA